MISRTNKESIRIWIIVVATLTFGTFLSATLAAIILDVLIARPEEGGGSVTTIIPGFVYAIATILKVCILGGLVSLVIALINRVLPETTGDPLQTPNLRARTLPIWAIASTTLAPLAPLVGALVIIVAQTFAGNASAPLIGDFSQFSRVAVGVSLFLISVGAAAAIASLVKRESPRLVPVAGLITNVVLIALFVHFKFYALGFHQDNWAP